MATKWIPSGKKWTKCKCPLCEKIHRRFIKFCGGKVLPRKYCVKCHELLHNRERNKWKCLPDLFPVS